MCIKNGEVLLSRRQNTGWADGMLVIPGGHVEAGETPRLAAVREAGEELGLKLTLEDLCFYCVAARKTGEECVAYEFYVKLTDSQIPTNTEPKQCGELIWVDPAHLPQDLIQDFADIITLGYLNKRSYLELGYK